MTVTDIQALQTLREAQRQLREQPDADPVRNICAFVILAKTFYRVFERAVDARQALS